MTTSEVRTVGPGITTEEIARHVHDNQSLGGLLTSRVVRHPDRTMLRWDGVDLTYRDVDDMANAAASALVERGIRAGDRVAIMMANSPEWVALWFALAKIGAVSVTVNTAHKGEGLAYILQRSSAKLLFADDDLAEHLRPLADDGVLPASIVGTSASTARFADGTLEEVFSTTSTRLPAVSVSPSSPCSILFTSGTTGPPKGCLLPHGQYLAAAHLHAAACEYGDETIAYTCLPLFHVNAQTYSLLTVVAAGGALALDQRFTASRFWERIAGTEATAFNFIGSMALALWSREPHPLEREHKARLAFGVPVPPDIWGAWEERFNTTIIYSYGMTENALPLTMSRAEAPVPARLRGASGVASPTSEVMIVDDQDCPVPPGTPGEILTRPKIPHSMMVEYIDEPEATLSAFRNFWFHTGDIGRMDEDGYVTWVDRKKDALRRRGEMVSSWELEKLIAKFPGVSACAVIGVASEMTEDDILVAVVCDGAAIDPAELIAYCDERTARFQVPRYVRIMDALPLTPTQRVEKYRLREEGLTPDTWDANARG